ncbi:MAG TPA: cobalamin-binding protein [Gammaproteobacteria bacterium]|jgi:5-methyltetrahydrofolate--homocysteine methyltransferase|nr:cobalamin-binding protein [Gammaproteobacteria bacterium]
MDNLFRNIAPGTHFIASIGDTTPPDADFDRLLYIGDRIEKEGRLPLKDGGHQTISIAGSPVDDPKKVGAVTIKSVVVDPAFEQIKNDVLEGEEEKILVHAQELLDQNYSAKDILNKGMLPAMDVISTRFSDGTVFIPEVLLSARAMNEGLKLLEPHLKKSNVKLGGRVLIGTVLGDLHDIGKNMVVSMMKGAGLEVTDMGVNVSTEDIVQKVRNSQPEVLALSALLTTTMPQMKEVIDALAHAGLRNDLKVIVGGAPVNQKFADQIGADGYAADAAEAVTLATQQVLALNA